MKHPKDLWGKLTGVPTCGSANLQLQQSGSPGYILLFLFLFFKVGFLCVALAVLELRDMPASVYPVLGLKVRD